MKCLYYLAPTLDSTHRISDHLHEEGVDDWYIHVVSKDEAGLTREHIHSSNYFETRDFLRTGFIGANLGFIIGVIGAGLLMFFEEPAMDSLVPRAPLLRAVILASMVLTVLLGIGPASEQLLSLVETAISTF